MAIRGFDRTRFEEVLKQYLSPTTPIRSPEFLRGRHKRLEEIRRSLVQPGRQIFVYGERLLVIYFAANLRWVRRTVTAEGVAPCHPRAATAGHLERERAAASWSGQQPAFRGGCAVSAPALAGHRARRPYCDTSCTGSDPQGPSLAHRRGCAHVAHRPAPPASACVRVSFVAR
jgi:hypothetical protein